MSNALKLFIDRISNHTSLSEEEKGAILDLPSIGQTVRGQQTIVHRGTVVESTCVVVKGLLARSNQTKEGSRQIISFYVAGDIPDLDTLIRPSVNFDLHAVSESEILRIPHPALRGIINRYPGIREVFWHEIIRDGDIAAEWVVNVGRRSAKERLAHLFCEMAVKTGTAEEENTQFTFPVTQETLGFATGLSTVHVNRSLQGLRAEGLLHFARGKVDIPNWQALVNAGGFDGSYLQADRPLAFAT